MPIDKLQFWIVLTLAAHIGLVADAADSIVFNRDIRPILASKCFQCHGPDENSREADLRLDVPEGTFGPFSQDRGDLVIKRGDPDASELMRRVATDNPDELMPPASSHKEPLSPEQLDLLRSWIDQGASYAAFWAFVPPKPQKAPKVEPPLWNMNRIDRFVLDRLRKVGAEPKPEADKRTLIRRLTFDLTGLPPTRSEIAEFLDDRSTDAYAKLVARLLSSPHYGEHIARYWLDVVRFADTNGIHHDHYREMTPYRDWVIRSFNDNLPFNEFVRYQLAGDLYDDPSIDQQIASGFNRLHLVIDVGTALPEESFVRNVVDRVNSVGTAFLGLTVGCAVCHDHKYDPMTQRDFYQLYAFFNNIDAKPETPGRNIHAPFIRVPDAEQRAQLESLSNDISNANRKLRELKQVSGGDDDQLVEKIKSLEERIVELREEKTGFEKTLPVSLVMKERDEVRPTHVLIRGAYDRPGEKVERDTPSFLPPMKSSGSVKTRMDLANWLTDPSHPLTARVTVNRIWQQFFGVGLVKTSEDFGTQGEWPSHPELLDDLAVNFVDSGWNVKQLVEQIVTSNTYKQDSKATAEEFLSDPENRRLARGSRYRLDAEMIRDQILSVSGLLNRTMYGKSVKPPQPPNLWKSVSMVSSSTYAFEADKGDKIYRRSVYSFWKRALPPPQMTIFDAPTREACIARRERTNTPLQALVLMNEPEYFKAALHFASQILECEQGDTDRIRGAYEAITARRPDDQEMELLQKALVEFRQEYRSHRSAADSLTRLLKSASQGLTGPERVELASYTMLVNAIFNLDITKTRD